MTENWQVHVLHKHIGDTDDSWWYRNVNDGQTDIAPLQLILEDKTENVGSK